MLTSFSKSWPLYHWPTKCQKGNFPRNVLSLREQIEFMFALFSENKERFYLSQMWHLFCKIAAITKMSLSEQIRVRKGEIEIWLSEGTRVAVTTETESNPI